METAREHICTQTDAKICSFLYEIAKGVTNYRSLHSVTQQVEHQYHGRFLIELIQNAHDALSETHTPGRPSRIAIVLDDSDSQYGTLLVANDGHPFTTSDFDSLSQLGQSNKDPQKSIGNKGIGFRSVLEISDRPEIFSKATPTSTSFDGFCFGFNPEVVTSLRGPVEALATSETVPRSPISGLPLVDWVEQTTNTFRSLVRNRGVRWLSTELNYLSPYLLPVPLDAAQNQLVSALQEQEFSTVVRLPLKSAEARVLVARHIGQLPSSLLLFLDRIDALELRAPGQEDRLLTRTIKEQIQGAGSSRVYLRDDTSEDREYGIWTRTLSVDNAMPELRSAISKLPGRWPEITEIPVSVAVRIGDDPEQGFFSIYLPTDVPTGSAVNINAPFYGNMSRTEIQFEDDFNKFVLQAAVELVVDVIFNQLAGSGLQEARLIVDMISPIGSDASASDRWRELLDTATGGSPGRIDADPVILADAGWRALSETSILPNTSGNELITADTLRRHATFDIFHECLSSRRTQLVDLANSRYSVGANPTADSLAETIEGVAQEVHERNGNWDAFWADTMCLLPGGQSELAKQKVLISTDGELHSSADTQHVFFPPRQGTDDAGAGNDDILEIPASLQSHVAFLGDRVALYKPGQKNEQTLIRDYLSRGLVATFRIENILATVIKNAIPELPTTLTGKNAKRCRDVLTWSLQLMRSAAKRRRGTEDTLTQFQRVPVPCRGGWYAMAEASFGEGWPESVGAALVGYLDERGDSASQDRLKRALLPPGHAAWGGAGLDARDLLLKGGVFDGIRLDQIEPDSWESRFLASSTQLSLPTHNPEIDQELWSEYVAEAEHSLHVRFTTTQQYRVGPLYVLPGMQSADVSAASRANLNTLILKSMPSWPEGWHLQTFVKELGQHDRQESHSVLWYFLSTRPWLAITNNDEEPEFAVPGDCWHVPANMVYRRATHFAHLHALPYDLAKVIDGDIKLAASFHALGMPYFDTESPTGDLRLINALTSAIGAVDAPDENVLLGQIRDAWSAFRPTDSSVHPSSLPVQDANAHLAAVEPTDNDPLYLPDLGTLTSDLQHYGKSVIAIMPDDARRLKEWFVVTCGDAITPTSELKLVPLVGGKAIRGGSGILLRDDDLAWLELSMLSLVAFHGQGRGLYSKAFEERQALLRDLTVKWVPELEIAVARGAEQLLTRVVHAYWDSRSKVLLVDEACKRTPSQMAPALAQALDRNDLELPLRFILGKVQTSVDPLDDLTVGLAELGISQQQVASVHAHMQGDLGQVVQLMHVLCAVLATDSDVTEILAVRSEDQLTQVVAGFGIEGLDIQAAIKTARGSQDLYEFGTRAAILLGQRAKLPRWNEVLVRLGRKPIENNNWRDELESAINEARGLFVRAIVSFAKCGDLAAPIALAMSQYDQLPPDNVDLSGQYWVVGFQEAMMTVADWLSTLAGAGELIGAIQGATSIEDLRNRLVAIGVDVNTDPDERWRSNLELVSAVVECAESIREAWWDKNNTEGAYEVWTSAHSTCVAALKDSFGDELFTTQLNEAAVLQRMSTQSPYSQVDVLQQALVCASNVQAFQSGLAITDQDVSNVQVRLDTKRAEDRRRKNTVTICGSEFDASEDNRANLWNFLNERVDFAGLASTFPLNLRKSSNLTDVNAASKRGNGKGAHKSKATKIQRQPKAIDETIGLAGEVFVFQMLQRKYGNDIVTAASWKSENSRYVFADNNTDDGQGCDFAFTAGKRTYYVEVKATAGNDESFKLGSSEISLAMRLASGRAARNARYVLVHVKNALSKTPELVVLPNPYNATSSKLFTIEEADARVRYKLRS